jgi:hypothetical protein
VFAAASNPGGYEEFEAHAFFFKPTENFVSFVNTNICYDRFYCSFALLLLPVFFALSGLNAAPLDTKTHIQYLSGTDKDHTVAWEFFCTAGRKSGTWTTIQVPSCWEQQGFGTYNYGRDYRTYGRQFSLASEKGMYRHRFTVPSEWKGRRVDIVFEGL